MTKISCKTKTKEAKKQLRVRIIKAPIVNSEELKGLVFARNNALVL
jgi:hypothetical protein